MDATVYSRIVSFIWGIADDVLRDLYVRGKYRDVILPMTVLRRLDAVLEDTKPAVLATKKLLDVAGIVNQEGALRQAARQAFYNASPFTLRDLRNRASQQQLRADFEAYLDGFSANVQEILDNFEFRNQIPRLARADALGTLIRSCSTRRSTSAPTLSSPRMGRSGSRGSTTTPWARSSRSWCAASMRRITRKRVSTGPRAMWCGSWPFWFSGPSPTRSSRAPTCFTTAPSARAAC